MRRIDTCLKKKYLLFRNKYPTFTSTDGEQVIEYKNYKSIKSFDELIQILEGMKTGGNQLATFILYQLEQIRIKELTINEQNICLFFFAYNELKYCIKKLEYFMKRTIDDYDLLLTQFSIDKLIFEKNLSEKIYMFEKYNKIEILLTKIKKVVYSFDPIKDTSQAKYLLKKYFIELYYTDFTIEEQNGTYTLVPKAYVLEPSELEQPLSGT